jgi:hypothetical protein
MPGWRRTEPVTDGERKIRDYLDQATTLQGTRRLTPRIPYPNPEALVLGQGQLWTPIEPPFPWRRDRMRFCYYYALRFVLEMEGAMRYVEGYAFHPRNGDVVPHAWAVDEQGRAWDVVWPKPGTCAYFGLVLPTADVLRFWEVDPECVGVLQREHLIGSPLLKTGRLSFSGKKGLRR